MNNGELQDLSNKPIVVFAHLHSAMFDSGEGPSCRGYIDRSGDIVFVYDNEGHAAAWMGNGVALDAVMDRAEVDANPDRWIEIPKLNADDESREQLMHAFLVGHGINASFI